MFLVSICLVITNILVFEKQFKFRINKMHKEVWIATTWPLPPDCFKILPWLPQSNRLPHHHFHKPLGTDYNNHTSYLTLLPSGLNPLATQLQSSAPNSIPSPVSGIDIAAMHAMLQKHHETYVYTPICASI